MELYIEQLSYPNFVHQGIRGRKTFVQNMWAKPPFENIQWGKVILNSLFFKELLNYYCLISYPSTIIQEAITCRSQFPTLHNNL